MYMSERASTFLTTFLLLAGAASLVFFPGLAEPIGILLAGLVGVVTVLGDRKRVVDVMSKAIASSRAGFIRLPYPAAWLLPSANTAVVLPTKLSTAFLASMSAPPGASPNDF